MIHFRTLGAVDLRDEKGNELRLALAQPKRLALLAYLAIATPAGFHRRDTMLSLFWPEMDQERARRALRQAVHFLRSTLGADVVQTRGGEDLGLASEVLWCDVRAFDDALARGALAEALELYRGDLLDGFFVSDASSDFEEWLEKERVRLRQRATAAAWSLSDQSASAALSAQAAEWARWAAAHAPDDERAQRRLMTLLDRQGDRTGALRVYEQLAQRAREEFEAEPSAESRALIASIRARDTVPATQVIEESVVVSVPAPPPPRGVPQPASIIAAGAPVEIEQPWAASSPAKERAPRRIFAVAAAMLAIAATGYAMRPGQASARRTAESVVDSPARPHGAASSPVASSFFDEGLRALYDKGDAHLARSFFMDALNADSTFAMAAYYVAICDSEDEAADASEMMSRAMRLGARSRERERLIIKTEWAMMADDPDRMAIAESLATKYPKEPEGQLALAAVLSGAGDFLGAVPHLRGVIASDTSRESGAPPFCAGCVAAEQLVGSYVLADSLPAAERVARDWKARKPQSIAAWSALRDILAREGRESDADDAERELVALDPKIDPDEAAAIIAIHADQMTEADHLLAQRLHFGSADAEETALWWMVIVRRNQGRLHDALKLARGFESLENPPPQTALIAAAQIAFEQRRFRDAANQFEALAELPPLPSPIEPGSVARHRSWFLTHAATAWASAGDTARLAQLADEVEGSARLSAYGRDWKLPHYLRGLLWNARGDRVQGYRELQHAIWSPTDGYTRASLELARASIVAGRSREAVMLLQAALRGAVEASNYYVTRTELHELLARTFESMGNADSAAAHYDVVARSWQFGDEPFHTRAAFAAAESAKLRR